MEGRINNEKLNYSLAWSLLEVDQWKSVLELGIPHYPFGLFAKIVWDCKICNGTI